VVFVEKNSSIKPLQELVMPDNRFYSKSEITKDSAIELDKLESHHLSKVMRGKVGDTLEVIDGKGHLAIAKVIELSSSSVKLEVISLKSETKTSNIVLAQGLPRMSHLELVIQKCTELGVDEFWLFPGDLSEKKEIKLKQIERLNTIIINATKQCGRLHLPSIVIKPPIKKVSKLDGTVYFGSIECDAPKIQPCSECIIFIGPEKGFSDGELSKLKQLGAKDVSLNKNVLRAETAAIAAVCLLAI